MSVRLHQATTTTTTHSSPALAQPPFTDRSPRYQQPHHCASSAHLVHHVRLHIERLLLLLLPSKVQPLSPLLVHRQSAVSNSHASICRQQLSASASTAARCCGWRGVAR